MSYGAHPYSRPDPPQGRLQRGRHGQRVAREAAPSASLASSRTRCPCHARPGPVRGPWAPAREACAYFPGPVAALRTLTSDVITGMSGATEAAPTAAEGQGWRTGGTHALIRPRK
ncbi:hypothetical protein P1P75_14200 [Streptomyces sp. ID05-39B]|uniref:hypothetical protein n=1 Tax=Streptomyces sp. ID05-39B TaxID=3028664 RepID=UPI0029BA0E96|nr:hypothetical protein [Streptomyces sp. ID05-39B]MDX3527565.1 hypothetical protein [Streptomyces sp. ID05-39B]